MTNEEEGMMGPRCRVAMLLLAVACLGLWPGVARCDPQRGWYLNGGLGIAHLDQEEGADPEADLGLHLGAACGFRFDRRWALELESGLLHNAIPDDGDEEGGSLSQIPLVLNAVFHFANPSRFEPYLGAGFGAALAWSEEDSGGDATLLFKAGVRHELNERAAIGLDYTFFMLGLTSAFVGEAVGNDTVNLSIRWRL